MDRRRLLVLGIVAVVAAGGGGAWWLLRPTAEAAMPVVMPVTSTTQRQTVSATGTVEPAEQADLTFAVSGAVTEVLVAEGDTVTAGQALAAVDDSLLTAQLDAAQSELDAAQARLDDSDSADSSDTAAAQAAVTSAESKLTAAQESVDQAQLTSTIAGTVVEVGLAVGDRVTGGAAPSQGEDTETAGITVVSTNRYLVSAKVGSADIEQVKAGLDVDITPVGGREPVAGTVTSVGLVATADESGAATFPVTIDVTGERDDIYAGSSATVEIVVTERTGVLTVPSLALHTEGDATYVYKMVDGARKRTDVRLGEAFGQVTEVVSGLAEGDEVEVAASSPGGGRAPGGGGGRAPTDGDVFIQDGGGMKPGTFERGGK